MADDRIAEMSQSEPSAKGGRREPQRLSSVAMSMRLLKAFSEGESEIGVTALSRKLGVAKSTVYRLASTLVAEGMLEQNSENEKYRLGIALFGLGALVRQRMNVSTEARQHIFALREATNETVHLALLDGSEVIYVYDLESSQAIRMRANLGERKPAFCASEGRAMLAFAPENKVEAIIAAGLVQRTPQTDVDPDHLSAALAEIRRIGYAVEDEQCEPGMRSLAAPVRDAESRVVAAVGIAGPRQRMDDEVLARFLPLLLDTAHTISSRLGYKAPAAY
ncbi:IclR family transcriptional regulator [Methylocella sp. CPCC 101449]|uniref:IclR family transcriptional regulator n=1 Tax=Methylocella sp. CPCC 101449 TaxID=2987531 RepID=UPI00288E8FCE|nr:IclR family transcriptional regulator [Methylocella sp. CPCC 101449]MDT2019493.1 IclR family transcriptional regulator [Methylocella sp. CPCC 101449]